MVLILWRRSAILTNKTLISFDVAKINFLKFSAFEFGDAVFSNTENFVTAVIDEKSFDKIVNYIENAKSSSDVEIIAGGNYDKSKGYFIEPTLFNNVDDSLPLAKEEVFGPVAISYKFKTTREAVNLANCLDTGLVAGVYTRDLSKALVLKDELDFGSVWINGWFIGGLQAPNGGVKNSGFGRERGLPGLMNYVSIKNIGISLSLIHI